MFEKMSAFRVIKNPFVATFHLPQEQLQRNRNCNETSSSGALGFKWLDLEGDCDAAEIFATNDVEGAKSVSSTTETATYDSNDDDDSSGDDDEDDVGKNYPKDCYSLIALYYPKENEWPNFVFFIGFVVFSFQIMFLLLLILSVTSEKFGTMGEIDNPGESIGATFFPANSKQIVRTTQIFQ
jgi:hypothetical protein